MILNRVKGTKVPYDLLFEKKVRSNGHTADKNKIILSKIIFFSREVYYEWNWFFNDKKLTQSK
jgi:hypothetical protein